MIPFKLVMSALALALFTTRISAQITKGQPLARSGNPLVTALWFSHSFAKPNALTPAKDASLKVTLIHALRTKSPGLAWDAVSELFEKDTFQKLAGEDKEIPLEKIQRMLQDTAPASRADLFPGVRRHAELLTTQFDLIDEAHRAAAADLVGWIARKYQSGKRTSVVVICTGNSRRSMLGSALGNVAAAYYGLPDLRFFSGGTNPSAFNARTIATLKEMGLAVESTGKEARRGKAGHENLIYRVQWGKGLEALEFSKMYSDDYNPKTGFAAILVCSEADTSCPVVQGASIRVAAPYIDPRLYDGAEFEAAKYAERRDDIGRFMLSAVMQARRRLELEGKLK
jgi:protein-tyrosine-phosphatase